jgi:hypothetical protein
MAFVVFKGERKVSELVARAFGDDLSNAERRRAAAAIRRANPHLADLENVSEGALVMVPDVPGVARAREARDEADPAADGVRELAKTLDEYRSELAEALEREAARIDDVEALLGDGTLQEVMGQEPGGEEQLDAIRKATEFRRQRAERSAGALGHIERTVEELADLAGELR